MKIWSGFLAFIGGEWLAAAAFKRTDSGWIFTAPKLWFGTRDTYRVDDQLKSQITAAYVRTWRFAIILPVLIAVIVGMPLLKLFPALQSGYDLLVYAAFGGVWGVVAMAFYIARIRSLLKGAEKATGTMSWSEQ